MLGWMLWVGLAAAQDAPVELESGCTETVSSSDLIGAMEVAENAWSMADAAGFKSATVSLESLIPCVRDPITRATAARIHRVNGMNGFLSRDPERMQSAFAAARYTQPGFTWPADLVPMDHPVQEHYVALSTENPALERTLPPKEGQSAFDGRQGLDRPTGWPTVHQHLAEDGAVMGTWLLWPDDATPDYPRKAVAGRTGKEDVDKRGARLPMLVGAGTGFLASGVLYGLAAQSSSAYHSDEVRPVDEMDKLRNATNTRYWASVGLAGASTVTTVGAFAVARW